MNQAPAQLRPISSHQQPVRGQLTYKEFLAWPEENAHIEWLDGEVVTMSPVSDRHNDITRFLLMVIGFFVDKHKAGAVRFDPFQMKTSPKLPGRSPDILFLACENLGRLKKSHLSGPADLAVEVISPASRERDRREKFSEYEQGGVREYWLIDPERQQADFYFRDESGVFQPMPLTAKGIIHSRVLEGLWLKKAWLWERPLPSVSEILKKLGLI